MPATAVPDPPAPTRPGAVRTTSADVARLAGVSVSAVSLAVNGRPGISPATRDRILAIAREHDWRPHRAARALKGAATGVVGLAIARPARTLGVEPFFAHLISGLQSRLSQEAVALQLLIVEDRAAEVATYERWSAEHLVDGVVLLDLVVDDPRPAALGALGLPAVALGGGLADAGVSSLHVDDHAAMVEVLEYLAALGHERVGHVAGTPAFRHTGERLRAVREASAELGLVVESVPTDFTDAQGAVATRRLLARRARPTALVFDSDVMAAAGLGVAAELRCRVPEDVSLVSFDDSVLTTITHPTLTALTRDTVDLGAAVADLLLRTVADRTPRHEDAATPHLVVRGSTGPPPVARAR